ncbi:MAG: hypothetical protein ACRD3W_27950, partial [Terriglobales bacterium]
MLPLAIAITWSPFNPMRLMEFLSLPAAPLPRRVCAILLDALRKEPGIGGDAWAQAWQKSVDYWKDALSDRVESNKLDRKLAKDIEAWTAWLDLGKFDPTIGMPAANASVICDRVRDWASGFSHSDDPLYRAAQKYSDAVKVAIEASGLKFISRPQMERMIDDALEPSLCVNIDNAERADWSVVDKPGQLWGPSDVVIWWNFVDTRRAVDSILWTEDERVDLQSCGVSLDPLGLECLRSGYAWRYPLLNARKQLILVMPRTNGGAAVYPHPVWHELAHSIRRADPNVQTKIQIKAEDILEGRRDRFGVCSLDLANVSIKLPPLHDRMWCIEPGTIQPRAVESFSGMNALISCPL